MNHTEVVNLVRAAPKVVDLVVGRILEPPKPPIEAHLLPDIMFQCHDESLGNGNINVYGNRTSLPLTAFGVLRSTQNALAQVNSTNSCGVLVLSDRQRSTGLYRVTQKHRYPSG